MENNMNFLTYFVAGLFFANGVPHFVNGISGRKFQSPFASPPGIGISSPQVNVIWGMLNFVFGYLLLFTIGEFKIGLSVDALAVALGAFLMSVTLSWYFGRLPAKPG
jgi:hypothetical protein